MAETTSMIFRIDPDLKKAFETAAKEMDRNASQLLRDYVRAYVQQHMARNAQKTLALPMPRPPETPPTETAPKKVKKGQRLANAKPANWKRP